jgi:phage-related tail protein
MPLYLQIQRHNPESCPVHNEKTKKIATTLMSKLGQLTKKHGIKIVGAWHSAEEHETVMVYDVPSIEAAQKFMMEPEVMDWIAYNTSQTKLVTTLEEAAKLYLR